MSCHLLTFSSLADVIGVRDYLFPSLKDLVTPAVDNATDDIEKEGDGWNEDWEAWNEGEATEEPVEEADTDSEVTDDQRHKWLQQCLLSMSPAADLVAMAHQNRLVLLSPKYETDQLCGDEDMKYSTVWSGSLTVNTSEFITAVLCLPLASQKRSTQGAPDWTCVLVGFSTGHVRMYTETGTLLLSQKLHMEPVQKLKCNTYMPPRYLGVAEKHEEVLILYLRALVTIDGFSLFQALKACRNQVARATASGEASLQPPPLAYKKWGPQGQETIEDCHTSGVHTPNPFDQMVLESLTTHNATIRPTPPAANMYLMSGMGPYLGFFYAVEGSAQPILSEVAFAVANKLKSAIISAASGWLSFGGKNKTDDQERQPKIEPATPLPLRFGLRDTRREGLSISLSPNNMYAATTDSFGRIMLIDVDRGLAVRMWKGYRDAQLGWIEVREEEGQRGSRNTQSRIAQFLVIYAARRGIVEVWMAGNGPRVAAFNVSKHCKLLHVDYGIMGLNNVTCRGVKVKAFQVALVNIDGSVRTVEVPFHLALSDKNNKRMRDLHLLKKLKLTLKEHSEESGELEASIKDLLLNIRISNIAQQGVDRILSTQYLTPKFYGAVLATCIQRLNVLGGDKLDIDQRLFLHYCRLQQHLIHTYTEIQALQGDQSPTDVNSQTLSRLLGLSTTEVDHIISEIEWSQCVLHTCKSPSRVRFEVDSLSHISTFLGCFTCHPQLSEQDGSTPPGHGAISLVKDLSEDRKMQLGSFMFERCLKHHSSASDLGALLRKSGIPMEDIARLLLWTWLSDDGRTVRSLPSLYNLLKIITSNIDKHKVFVDSVSVSPWWQAVRDLVAASTHCQSAYLVTVVARSIAAETAGRSKVKVAGDESSGSMAKDPDADIVSDGTEASVSQEGEPVSADGELWNRLVKQTEDVTALDGLLGLQSDSGRLTGGTSPVTVSAATLLDGGKGCVTEVVSRHVARVGFMPADLYRPIPDDPEGTDDMTSTDGQAGPHTGVGVRETIWDQMKLLRKRFPHSLENDVLFSNSCWEYTVQWNKDPEEMCNLTSALDFLRLVQNALLRHGVASMMWHMFILKRFQASAQLMEKVGKVPKDRLCRKEIGVSEVTLPKFLDCVCDFLNVIMEANCESNEVPVFNIEPNWSHVKGTVSLAELAIDQKPTNYGLLKHHNHLAMLMHAVLVFNMKSVRVITLFDSKGKNSFFQELHQHPLLPNQNVDSTIATARKQMMTRVISQAVMRLHESISTTPPSSPIHSRSQLRQSEPARWPARILDLAQDFGLDLDLVKRHHVCELYSVGLDRLAEEVVLTVNDHESLGSQLLTISGRRLAHHLSRQSGPAVVETMSNANPALSTWLKSMNPKLLVQPDCPISDLKALVNQTINQLAEGHSEYNMAVSLVELLQSLPDNDVL